MADLTVILNETSGNAATRRRAVEEAFARAKLDVRIEGVNGARIREAAARAAASRRTLVAAGGDGTVSAVASVAAGTGATLGVLPLGTLNHFARDVGIPLEIDPAVDVIAAGYTRLLDIGMLDDRTFVNNASLGYYPRIVRERELERSRGHRKWVAFAIAVTRTWIRYRTVRVLMEVDGVALRRRTPFVFIGNGEYKVEGLDIGTRTSLDSGRLWIYVAPECGRFEMLMLSIRALGGLLGPAVKLEVFSAGKISIETRRVKVAIAIDGELVVTRPPLHCMSRSASLRTIVPRIE